MRWTALSRLWGPATLSLLRIVSALIFMEHGTAKILGFPAWRNQPALLSMSGLGGLIEMIGGFLLTIGLFSRPVAFLMSGEMAVGYWMSHAPRSFFPLVNGGDGAILYCFVFLYIFIAGPGPWSLDALWHREGLRA